MESYVSYCRSIIFMYAYTIHRYSDRSSSSSIELCVAVV